MELLELAELTRQSKFALGKMTTDEKNKVINAVADALEKNSADIIKANEIDMAAGANKLMSAGLLDRLKLTEDRIKGIADGLRQVALLDDPIGKVSDEFIRPNGLKIQKRIVPIGVVGVIYEARPNVTADVFSLCYKTGNAVLLKGGSDAIESNKAIVKVIRETIKALGYNENACTLIEDTSRQSTKEMMRLNGYIDVLIPRGGAGLIKSVVENASVPVIETGSGNCHIYVDKDADLDMAVEVIDNAKTQRIGVCNACESLVVHEDIIAQFLPKLNDRLMERGVRVKADDRSRVFMKDSEEAFDSDFAMEYLDLIISVKTVNDIDEAISHINKNNTGHSESIITNDTEAAEKFLNEIDAACVYVNASTRFTDGFEFGFGAEIGISTQKLHARGPMGLMALTSYKYTIYGNGQIRK
ncbi:MAG: glutamate-5-semialdehyde dehydrogenase [Pseudobutyrivibrio sp.]|nr:glutamate-5-semialdehyde dehydrogenase [Pseudobutyrivibrio sp.]